MPINNLSILQSVQDLVDGFFTLHLAVPEPRGLNHHHRTVVTCLHATGAGDLGVQAAVDDLVLDIGQQTRRALLVTDAFGITVSTKTGADKEVVLWFINGLLLLFFKLLR